VIDKLKEHALKVTPQRQKLLELLEKEGHLSIESLYEQMRESFPNVSLATIYKNLNQMEEYGLLKEIKLPERKSVYEITKGPHMHMVCDRCGKVEDIIIGTASLVEEAERLSGYAISESFVTFRGICPDCRAKEA
jgi:Fe2+ or Zn2+ uptake regulation protein